LLKAESNANFPGVIRRRIVLLTAGANGEFISMKQKVASRFPRVRKAISVVSVWNKATL
jgi:hypothetical protein